MKKILTILTLSTLLNATLAYPPVTFAQSLSSKETKLKEAKHIEVDDHHEGHTIKANFIPGKILNPDDSLYQAPSNIENYVGLYEAQTELPQLGLKFNLILSIEESGLFNLAYYFTKQDGKDGIRFYVNDQGKIESIKAPYQDLVVLTGGLKEFEGGLGSGLIRKTLSPVVLLDNQGKAEKLYPYQSMAYDLRENYQDARVYQNVGLYVIDGEIIVDVNHLIGLNEDKENRITLKTTNTNDEDAFLIEKKTYEVLQEGFDHYLDNYNDFKLEFDNSNDFVQVIQAMHLKTNASFPPQTKFELLDPNQVEMDSKNEHTFALLINDQILYFYDGEKLYVANEIEINDGNYSAQEWQTN